MSPRPVARPSRAKVFVTELAAGRGGQSIAIGAASAARLLALLVPSGLLLGALGSQYLGGLVPCEMCYWQRWPHAAAIVLAALAFTAPATSVRATTLTLLAALAIAASGAIGAYHAGVELGIFEGLTACSASGGAVSLDSIFATPLVRCDEIQWAFLGVSMAGWNAILSLGAAALILLLLRRSQAA
jgi:disulfide bond formation protein DsbB